MTQPHRPGDHIINRYLPDCSDEDREIARTRLQGMAALLLKIAIREVKEEQERDLLAGESSIPVGVLEENRNRSCMKCSI